MPPRPPVNLWSPNDNEALSRIRIFGLIGIAGLVIGSVTIIGLSGLNYLNALLSNTPGRGTFSVLTAFLLLGTSLGSIVLWIIAVVYGRAAFRLLSPVDRNFQTPLSLSYGLYVGFVLLFVGVTLTITATLLGSAGANADIGVLLLLVGGLTLLGAVVALLVGFVGLLLGIWRFGSRYDEGLFKAAAIIYIIPVASIVAPILIYLGAGAVEGRLRDFIPPKEVQGAL